jgi:hypothetical protein
MKWMGALLALLAVIGLVAASRGLSCAEVDYSGGTLVDCGSMSIFQPSIRERDTDGEEGVLGSIPLPPSVMGFLGAMYHGNCKTTEVAEGQWTVCNDGFSMLERDGALAAWALGLRPGEERFRNANAADELEDDDMGASLDCGPFDCADYLVSTENPEMRAYVDSLSPRDRARLRDNIDGWKREEIERDLVQARAANTALHERLKEMEAYEAQLERAEPLARVDPGSMAQGQPER